MFFKKIVAAGSSERVYSSGVKVSLKLLKDSITVEIKGINSDTFEFNFLEMCMDLKMDINRANSENKFNSITYDLRKSALIKSIFLGLVIEILTRENKIKKADIIASDNIIKTLMLIEFNPKDLTIKDKQGRVVKISPKKNKVVMDYKIEEAMNIATPYGQPVLAAIQ